MMHCNSLKLLFVICLLSASTSFSAQSRLDSLQYLNEVVVIHKLREVIVPNQTLSGNKLLQLSSHNVADALRYFAGVQIKDYGGVGGLKTVNVRNMGTTHVGVFFDGLALGNAQNGTTDLGKFSLDDMETISLYIGQKSKTLQAAKEYASASVIYLQTKKPKFEESKKTNLVARYKVMDMNFYNPSFRLEQKINKNVSVSISSEYTNSDGKYKFRYTRHNIDGSVAYDTTGIRQNSDITALRVETGVYGKINEGLWDAKLYYYDSDRGSPSALVENHFKSGFRQADKNFFAQSNFIKQITSNYKIHLRAKFAFDYMKYVARDTTTVLGETVTEGAQFDNSFYQREFYFSMANSYRITPVWDVDLAIDYQWNVLNATMKGVKTPFAYPSRNSIYSALSSNLNLGKFKTMVSLMGIAVYERVRNGATPPNKHELAPAIFLGYKPFDARDFNIRAFAKRNFRMPTFNDIYYTQIGASLLKPEFMNQYDIGFTYVKPLDRGIFNSLSIQTDAYYTVTKDKIIAAPTGSLFRWMMSNIGKVRGKGLETVLGVGMNVGEVSFLTNFTYTYSESTNYTKIFGLEMSSYGDQIPYTPWHSGSIICDASYKSWNLNYSFIYVGKRYNGGENNIKANELQPWYAHDVSLQKQFKINRTRVVGTVEVNNALNQFYEVVYNYPMPGRTFRFIISVEI